MKRIKLGHEIKFIALNTFLSEACFIHSQMQKFQNKIIDAVSFSVILPFPKSYRFKLPIVTLLMFWYSAMPYKLPSFP